MFGLVFSVTSPWLRVGSFLYYTAHILVQNPRPLSLTPNSFIPVISNVLQARLTVRTVSR